ncbi:unnamed protein product [Clonostachys rosea f. rosea IK726]|uniref:Branched-chain-amino-acid aminotransferase n=2 Tax=Bionectria ochroleuca TaxID=29856 RepID=A0A0B7JNB1_BIOOC|nr:unnamed protein product [Clonostachys rosea f. rosea IK726]
MAPTAIPLSGTQVNTSGLEGKEALASGSNAAQLDASKIKYKFTANPRAVPDEATANASDETICTDHMITAVWKASTGWESPELKPYGPLSIMPTASVLNYATECFEGMKAYRGDDGQLRLFRPNLNCERLNVSASRISLPTFDPEEMEKLIVTLLSVDGARWLPKDRAGGFLYIRPILIGTQPRIGVHAPKEALFYIMAGFIPRLDSYPGGMRLHTSPDDLVRAWVGGYGYAKIGANYGPSMIAKQGPHMQGFHEILWLYGDKGECTEAGASNFFVVWKRKDGKTELITAPLDDKLILSGVTRRSCLEFVRQKLVGDIEVTERKFTIGELFEAQTEGRILESFATGTGFFVCPISQIRHRGQDIMIPIDPKLEAGEITHKIKTVLGDILYGRSKHSWGVVVPEKE